MTPRPEQPATAAGQRMDHLWGADFKRDEWRTRILAIEREAARLARPSTADLAAMNVTERSIYLAGREEQALDSLAAAAALPDVEQQASSTREEHGSESVRDSSGRSSAHEHEWVWMHDWWGVHVCECGAVQESPPGAKAALPDVAELAAALFRVKHPNYMFPSPEVAAKFDKQAAAILAEIQRARG